MGDLRARLERLEQRRPSGRFEVWLMDPDGDEYCNPETGERLTATEIAARAVDRITVEYTEGTA